MIDHKCLPVFEDGNGWICSICHYPCESARGKEPAPEDNERIAIEWTRAHYGNKAADEIAAIYAEAKAAMQEVQP